MHELVTEIECTLKLHHTGGEKLLWVRSSGLSYLKSDQRDLGCFFNLLVHNDLSD